MKSAQGFMFWFPLPFSRRLHDVDGDEAIRCRRILAYKSGRGLKVFWLPGTFEAIKVDRERKRLFEWAPSRSLLASIRAYQRHRARRNPVSLIVCKLMVLRHRFWSVVTGAEIPLNSHIGGSLLLPHPNGIVIHDMAVIGANCLIFQQVTIGTGSGPGYPVIGDHVDIGAGAKILGGVQIGAHAKIGANAVVISDVPPHATAVGVPARAIGRVMPERPALATQKKP
jgi:serine O-acetyltransferase